MSQNNGISSTAQEANSKLLSEMIRLGGAMSESQAMDYFVRLLDALQFVHASDKLHLNIAPYNVVVDTNGMIGLINSRKNGDSYNPSYTPLEVITNSVAQGPWSDIYGAGATLYNMLTGKQPPKTDDIISLGNNAFDFTGVSRLMQQLICKMMSPILKQRPQSVSDVWQLISNLAEDEQPSSAPQAPAIAPNMQQSTPAAPNMPQSAPAVPNVSQPAPAPQPIPVAPAMPSQQQPQPSPVAPTMPPQQQPQPIPVAPAMPPQQQPQPSPVAPTMPPQQPAINYYGSVAEEKKKSGSRLGLFILGGVLIVAAIAGAAVMLWPKEDKTTDDIENTSEATFSYSTEKSDVITNTDTALNTNSLANEEPANEKAYEPTNDIKENYDDQAAKEAKEREAEKKRKAEEMNNQKAEQNKPQANTNKVLDYAPVMPSFPKGNNKIMDFINSRKHNPTGETGFVVVQFVVNKNGSLSNFKVVKSMSPKHDQEALRVCKMLPNFIPGRDANGNPVNVKYALPVRF